MGTNKHKTTLQKAQSLKRSAMSFILFRALVKNRRAVSAVISNLILIVAVISIGLVALGFARSTSISYQTQYAESMGSDIGKLKESLTFEYVSYDNASKDLSVYFMNSGIMESNITRVYVNNSPVTLPTVQPMNGEQQIANNNVGKGVEGFFVLNLSSADLHNGELNTIKLTTGRDSNFAYNFLA